LNGSVDPAVSGDVGAKNMITQLHLNHPELIKDRADILMFIDGEELDETDFFADGDEAGQSYAHVAYQHLGLSMP
jgi:hypothetical protein